MAAKDGSNLGAGNNGKLLSPPFREKSGRGFTCLQKESYLEKLGLWEQNWTTQSQRNWGSRTSNFTKWFQCHNCCPFFYLSFHSTKMLKLNPRSRSMDEVDH
jgi:hypothetical protein